MRKKTQILKSTYQRMPWKNGLGETAEIDRVPSSAESYHWRLSQALIRSASPFSFFPGYQRWLIVVQGAGLDLNNAKLEPLTPIHFSGETEIFCKPLGSEVVDLGLIYDPLRVEARMQLVEGELRGAGEALIHYVYDIQTGDTTKYQALIRLVVPKSVLITISPR